MLTRVPDYFYVLRGPHGMYEICVYKYIDLPESFVVRASSYVNDIYVKSFNLSLPSSKEAAIKFFEEFVDDAESIRIQDNKFRGSL